MKKISHMTNPLVPFSGAVSPRSRLIVGVSGGCDSIALLRLLVERRALPSRSLIAAHVNYGLRGKQSQADEKWVRHICAQWKVPLRILKVRNLKAKLKRNKKSLQDQARELRYSFFQRLAKKEKAWGVAVAHHLEDQAETVLDRFLRGSGAKGLSGLHEVQILNFSPAQPALKVWRPLLHATKESLKDYLRSQKIAWREDRSNQKLQYRRNQVRHEALPFLSRWNPRLTESLARMGEVTAVEDELMDQFLDQAGKDLKGRWKKDAYFCRGVVFQKTHLAIQRRWVRRIAEKLVSNARGLSFDRVDEILRIWGGLEKGPRDVGYGLSAGTESSWVYLRNLGLKKHKSSPKSL
jgi:tRNA(Ile)-lysidine synthase